MDSIDLCSLADYSSRMAVDSRWGIRKRSVLSAVVVVTFSLLVGGAFLLLVLQSSLTSAAWSNLSVRASDVAQLLREDGIEETQSTLAVASRCRLSTPPIG
jgi:hypothetical protein